MQINQLFQLIIPELKSLPPKPKVFWYVSAGNDFRGTVFLTDYKIQHELQYHNRVFEKPDLFVFNCLGAEVKQLKEKLKDGNPILFEDESTKIIGKNYKPLSLDPSIQLQVNQANINLENVEVPNSDQLAFYFEAEIIGLDYRETKKILYFEHENIDFFEKVILKDYFEVLYLCALREGTGFGNAKKSIIEEIYHDHTPHFCSNTGFKPNYTILFNDFTKEIFENSLNRNTAINLEANYGNYITKNLQVDSTIYKLDYKS